MSVIDSDKLINNLLGWYQKSGRILPWREDPTPYHVWVSEIMLQQTRVEAVKGYYARFLAAFPDVRSLADADEEILLKIWEGLGYYNRARNMQKAARMVMESYGGVIPSEYEELLKLSGIGEYTAAAIASIAYGKSQAVVDGNVLRVMTRILADSTDISLLPFRRQLASMLNEMLRTYLQPQEVGMFNQAMMDLGATVCTPNGMPKCEQCPVRECCKAYEEEHVLSYPVKAKAKARKIVEMTVMLIRNGDYYVITKRKPQGLLAGMYEFPNVDFYLNEKQCVDYVTNLGFYPLRIEALPSAVHIFTHKEWHMKAYEVRVADLKAIDVRKELILATGEMMRSDYAIPSAFGAYLQMIM